MDVKHEHRKKHINNLMTVFNASGFGTSLNYLGADLLYKTLILLDEKKGNVKIEDITLLRAQHDATWQKYFDQLRRQTLN